MRLAVGAYNKLPHYAVIGTAVEFYIWQNEDGSGSASNWIKGAKAFELWHKLNKYIKKDKTKFVSHVKELHTEYRKEC